VEKIININVFTFIVRGCSVNASRLLDVAAQVAHIIVIVVQQAEQFSLVNLCRLYGLGVGWYSLCCGGLRSSGFIFAFRCGPIVDTNVVDTNVVDTNVVDTNVVDTNVVDTNAVDTKVVDQMLWIQMLWIQMLWIQMLWIQMWGIQMLRIRRIYNYLASGIPIRIRTVILLLRIRTLAVYQ
jgi:hypothetical protein